MDKGNILITLSQLKSIARFEKTFYECVDASSDSDYYTKIQRMEFEDVYHMTLEDLKEAFTVISGSYMKDKDLISFWLDPILDNKVFFGIRPGPESLSYEDEDEYKDEKDPFKIYTEDYITLDEKEILDDCLRRASRNVISYIRRCKETTCSNLTIFREVKNDIDLYIRNRGKGIRERDYPDWQKEEYLEDFIEFNYSLRYIEDHLNDSLITDMTEDMEYLAKRFIDELLLKEVPIALKVKAYCQYEGNRLFSKDVDSAYELFKKLYSLTGEADVARVLGDIYYYGQAGDGVPDYDSAFSMYTAGYLGRNINSAIKLGEMFCRGEGCIQSEISAFNAYNELYHQYDFLTDREEKKWGSFQLAYKLGQCYRDGTGVEQDLIEAYRFFLIAEYCSFYVMRRTLCIDDYDTARKVRDELCEIKSRLPDNYLRDSLSLDDIKDICNQMGYMLAFTVEKMEDGRFKLVFENKGSFKPIFITIPHVGRANLLSGFEITAEHFKGNGIEFGKPVSFHITRVEAGRLYLIEATEIVADFSVSGIRLTKRWEDGYTKTITFADVKLKDNDRIINSSCNGGNVIKGDKVGVIYKNSYLEGTVENIEIKDIYSLDIPLYKYPWFHKSKRQD